MLLRTESASLLVKDYR